MLSKQIQTDQNVEALAVKLSESLDFATDAEKIHSKLEIVQPTVVKLFEQITECCIFIREYTGRGFASELSFHIMLEWRAG